MERELNKLFNDTNYNKENVPIREIWSIKLELQNFIWGVYINAVWDIMHLRSFYRSNACLLQIQNKFPIGIMNTNMKFHDIVFQARFRHNGCFMMATESLSIYGANELDFVYSFCHMQKIRDGKK